MLKGDSGVVYRETEIIRKGGMFIVSRAVRASPVTVVDSTPKQEASSNETTYIIKKPKLQFLRARRINAILRKEYEFGTLLSSKSDYFLRPCDWTSLDEHNNQCQAVIWEDFTAVSLLDFLHENTSAGFSYDLFFPIAIQMAEALFALHEAGIIHHDIKNSNFIIQPLSNRIWLIDLHTCTFWLEARKNSQHDHSNHTVTWYVITQHIVLA